VESGLHAAGIRVEYPKPRHSATRGRDRNARSLQFSCFLLASAVGAILIVSAIGREWEETPILLFAITGSVAAAVIIVRGSRIGLDGLSSWSCC